jgi:hypothetical protein
MKPSEHEKLLKELLLDEALADFRKASLERGLASMRRHRRQRELLRGGAVTTVAGLLVLGLILKHPHPNDTNIAAVPSPAPALAAEHVKFINDDELLAMFPQGSVALIGKPGQKRLVFLDKTPGETPQAPF